MVGTCTATPARIPQNTLMHLLCGVLAVLSAKGLKARVSVTMDKQEGHEALNHSKE